MAALVVVIAALGLSAGALLRWASDDYAHRGRLSDGAAIAGWLIGLTHAALVATAASSQLLGMPVPATAALAFGGGAALGGVLLLVRAVAAFGSLDEILGRTNGALVTRGPYALTRNPQALGWGLLLTGGGVAGRSLAALLLVIPYWVLLAMYLPIEERHLRTIHGERYRAYAQRVPRVLGRSGVRAQV